MAVQALLVDYVDVLDVENHAEFLERRRIQMLRKRELRDVSDPFMIGDENFRKLYRMTPDVAIEFIEKLRPNLKDYPQGIKPHMQLRVVLRFLAEGPYQKGISNDLYHPMSQSSVS